VRVVIELLLIFTIHVISVAPWVNSVEATTNLEVRRQVDDIAGFSQSNLKRAEVPLAPDLDTVHPGLVCSIRRQPWNQTRVVAIEVAATAEDVRHDEPAYRLLH
jgi:hypothetical protein